ncbi:hypothetical protein X736_19750 [Mesorhizobium sp. L2C089B000]|nr:hypothetical protein X736_19750 [Mesorhizobium sp. L2C089B000]
MAFSLMPVRAINCEIAIDLIPVREIQRNCKIAIDPFFATETT